MPASTERFSDRVEHYVRSRPNYPTAFYDFLENDLRLPNPATIAPAPTPPLPAPVKHTPRPPPTSPPPSPASPKTAPPLPNPATIADTGSGTGISTNPPLERGHAVHAIEPNQPMRAAAEKL